MSTNVGEIVTIESGNNPPTPDAPWQQVNERFTTTMQHAEEMLDLLVGTDGDSGYLGELRNIIQARPTIDIPVPSINTSVALRSSGLNIPSFNRNDLSDFPTENIVAPILSPIPSVPTDGLDDITKPSSVNPTMAWSESTLSDDVYPTLLAQIIADLTSSSGGINQAAETALYDRARTRQQIDRVAEWNRINNTWATKLFPLPTGSLLSALTEFSTAANRQDADIENQIIVDQATRATQYRQFVIQQATALEQLLRQTRDGESGRALDAEKSRVQFILQSYAEQVNAYIAELKGEETRISAFVEMMKGVIEENKGKVEIYTQQNQALNIRTNAVASQNESMVKVFQGEVSAFAEAERGVAMDNEQRVKLLGAQIEAATVQMNSYIEEGKLIVAGYSAENSLKERVTSDMAHIAGQAVASWASAVNASASVGYSAGESKQESWSHHDSLSESHNYEHDPLS